MGTLDEAIYGYETSGVYVMDAEGTHSVKIGISKKPKTRMDELQTGSASSVIIFWVGRVPKESARSVERATHALLKDENRHIRGEWFQCSAAYARGAVIRAAESIGVPIANDISYDMRHRG